MKGSQGLWEEGLNSKRLGKARARCDEFSHLTRPLVPGRYADLAGMHEEQPPIQ